MLIMSLANVKARFSEFVNTVHDTHERVIVTRNGEPTAILLAYQDYESLIETLAVLSDPDTVAAIREAEAEIERDEPGMSSEEMSRLLAARTLLAEHAAG